MSGSATRRAHLVDISDEQPGIRRLNFPSIAKLKKEFVSKQIPQNELYRFDPGRGLTLDHIANAITAAEQGSMAELCDIGRKTIDVDPTLASLLQRRFGVIEAADDTLTPAAGEGIDKELAKTVADVVRTELCHRLPIKRIKRDLMWGTWDGRSAQELMWSNRAPTADRPLSLVIGESRWIHPRRLWFGPERELRLADDFTAIGGFWRLGIDLESPGLPYKFAVFKPRLFGEYPEREGLALRCLYWAFFKRFSARKRMILAELFAHPWKILEVDQDTKLSVDEMDDAVDQVESLGITTTARLPKGMTLRIENADPDAGEVLDLTIKDCDAQLAKLIVGNTLTTEQGDTGARALGEVHEGQQDLIAAADGWRISEVLQQAYVEPLVLLNAQSLGLSPEQAKLYVPTIEVRTTREPNRAEEQQRLKGLADMGVPIAVEEAYEVSGFRPPNDDEATLESVEGPFGRVTQVMPSKADQKRVTDELAKAKAEAEAEANGEQDDNDDSKAKGSGINIPATDLALIVTVNEARAAQGLPALEGPDGNLTVAEFKAKHAETVAAAKKAEQGTAPSDPEDDPDDDDDPEDPDDGPDGPPPPPGSDEEDEDEDDEPEGERQLAAGKVDPEDVLIQRGTKRALRALAKWTTAVLDAVTGKDNPGAIAVALSNMELQADELATELEQTASLAAMLGAMEADDEVRLADGNQSLLLDAGFVRKPFWEALKFFERKRVLPKELFEQLTSESKRYAFTVAGIAQKRLLDVAKSELERSILDGTDLRKFRKALAQRFELAGWTKLNPSHVETVFRNAVLGAYSAGRKQQLRQPAVLERRPYWQVLATKDSRTRKEHRAIDGNVLKATDPVWDKGPPFGHQCRCRWRSLTAEDVERKGLTVIDGSTDSDWQKLPDPGWSENGPLKFATLTSWHNVISLAASTPAHTPPAAGPDGNDSTE